MPTSRQTSAASFASAFDSGFCRVSYAAGAPTIIENNFQFSTKNSNCFPYSSSSCYVTFIIHNLPLTTKWRVGRGTYICPPSPANVFILAFWLIGFEAVRNTVRSLGKLSRMSNLLFQKKYFRKTLFYPTTAYSRLCNSEHTCMKVDPLCSSELRAWSTKKHFGVI